MVSLARHAYNVKLVVSVKWLTLTSGGTKSQDRRRRRINWLAKEPQSNALFVFLTQAQSGFVNCCSPMDRRLCSKSLLPPVGLLIHPTTSETLMTLITRAIGLHHGYHAGGKTVVAGVQQHNSSTAGVIGAQQPRGLTRPLEMSSPLLSHDHVLSSLQNACSWLVRNAFWRQQQQQPCLMCAHDFRLWSRTE